MKKVVVAMSGGVDSSVAAALLQEAGYQVIGATMQIWPRDTADTPDRCCGLNAIEDARKVAYDLGIPHYVLNLRDIFAREVIADFCREYSLGRTPNPCIRCNQYIKFGAFLEKAMGLGDFIATGHHARIEVDGSGRYCLKKGIDQNKDQSYFLYPLNQGQLGRTLLPIGNLTKKQVREIATGLGLPVAAKPGSVEICFIPDDDYARFLRRCNPRAARPGPVLDSRGNVLGRHEGILYYTIGQRKGLGLSGGERRYVIAIEPERDAIVVGSKDEACGSELVASGLNWIAIDRSDSPIAVRARIRYRHPEAEAEVSPLGDGTVCVKFAEPQMAITPGQAIVFYRGDTVIGGGTIERTREASDEGKRARGEMECLNRLN